MSVQLRLGLWLLGSLFCLYLLTSSPVALHVGDGAMMIGDAAQLWRSGFREPEQFSKFGLGQAVVALPVVPFLARLSAEPSPIRRVLLTLAASALPALLAAGTCLFFCLSCLELGYSRRVSVGATLLLGLTSMQWVYSQSLFADSTLGFLWLAAFYCLLCLRRGVKAGWWVLAAGLLCGYGVLVKPTAVIGLIIVGLWLALPRRLERDLSRSDAAGARVLGAGRMGLLYFAAGVLPFLLLFFCFNHLRYGQFLNTGYATGRDVDFGFSTPLLTGLYGLLFSSGKGVFWYNPTLLLGLVGIPRFWRSHTRESLLAGALVLGTLLLHACWWAWHGDWSWGPRFLVPVLPFAFFPAAAWLEYLGGLGVERRLQRRLLLGAMAVLCAVGLWVQGLGLCIPYHSHILLVLNHTRVFEHQLHDAESWPIRDDMLQVRFIPEFSPLAGHWWLLRCALLRGTAAGEVLAASPPWRGLNPQWTARAGDDAMGYNTWWLTCWQQRALLGDRTWLLFGGFLVLLCALVLCIVLLVESLYEEPDDDTESAAAA